MLLITLIQCNNSVRNVTAWFEIFDGSVDEDVVLWDFTAIHETYFYDLSTVLKMSILWSTESRLWHPHSYLFFVYLWKLWSLQSWVESGRTCPTRVHICKL